MPVPPAVYDVRLLFEQALMGESDLIRLNARVKAAARRLGFQDIGVARLQMIAAEMATNQAKYAHGRGLMQVWEAQVGRDYALDLFALDYGPGIAQVDLAITDGTSSGGTLGKGLGAIGRLAHDWGLVSRTAADEALPWRGTALWARLYAGSAPLPGRWSVGVYRRAYQDARDNGDGFWLSVGEGVRLLHLDAVGHGAEAAAVVASACAHWHTERPLAETFLALEQTTAMKRGAAAVCYEAHGDGDVLFGGIGDMQACLLQGSRRQSLSLAPGILGQVHGRVAWGRYPWPVWAVMVSASDGLRHRWPAAVSALGPQPPQLVAYFLGQVLGRLSDDRSCVVIRRGA
ncbi:MAG: ATP-binding protein [Acidiferrobacter sp.]